MRGSVCGAPALSQTLQKLLERVESLERLTEVLRGDVVKATSLASHYKREMDDRQPTIRRRDGQEPRPGPDLLHENREIRQQLDHDDPAAQRALRRPAISNRWQQNDCEIASLSRRTDELASEVTKLFVLKLGNHLRLVPPYRLLLKPTPQVFRIPYHLLCHNGNVHRQPPRPPPSRSSSVPARPRASWSRPSSPWLRRRLPELGAAPCRSWLMVHIAHRLLPFAHTAITKRTSPHAAANVHTVIALGTVDPRVDIVFPTLKLPLSAFTPSHQKSNPITSLHGVDLLLGGHDHLYFIPKGADAWDDFDHTKPQLGGEEDKGDVMIIKSGNDFRDLMRKWVISKVTGKRRITEPSIAQIGKHGRAIEEASLPSVGSSLKAPVCQSKVQLDLRGYPHPYHRVTAGNWFADIIRPAYDDTLFMHAGTGADGVFICAGTLRGDSTYGPGTITLGDIWRYYTFEDPAIVLEMDGHAIWEALEAGLSTYPAQEGRFPVIAGFKVDWDSRREPGNRVLEVSLIEETDMDDGALVDEEGGMLMSAIVRKYLIGSHFLNRVTRLQKESGSFTLHPRIQRALSSERSRSRTLEVCYP
ncbi:hypothetical protein BKA70DRAFT_1578481 [Coprinopsis sp. MPI-PUGE-AT-0042]|nr:hypothetical protein BKA70DRAFT_1578481 [Coprinopsis sp. MPI-PUGE-AT-0042]